MSLIINVINARDIPTEWFDKVDAYVKIRYQGEEKTTKVDRQAGTEAAFNQSLSFHNKGAIGDLEVALYDDDVFFDDFLAKAVVDLDHVSKYESVRGFFKLVNAEGKPAGEIKLEITFSEN